MRLTSSVAALLLLTFLASCCGGPAVTRDRLTPLYNGHDLTGWNAPDPNLWWKVMPGGILVAENDLTLKGNNLFTLKDYKDVEFELEYRYTGEVDTGVFLRKPLIQIQIGISRTQKIDKTASLYSETLRGGYVGNATGVEQLLKPGEWNHLRFIAKGDNLKVWLNGQQVLDCSLAKYPDAAPLGLQIHAGLKMKVEFRNIKAREIVD